VIILIARFEVDPSALTALRPLLDTTMRATWEESDCLSYSIAVESEAAGVISVVERWRSEAALLDYLATPAMTAFGDALNVVVISMDAHVYDVTGERALPPPPAFQARPTLTLVVGSGVGV
jgi:quinol monooxygenase YgiN